VIGQTLAIEGMFAFFLESAFVGGLIGVKSVLDFITTFCPRGRLAFRFLRPGHHVYAASNRLSIPRGLPGIDNVRAYLLNPWALVQFSHNQIAAVVTASFVVTSLGAFYALRRLHAGQAKLYLHTGTSTDRVAPRRLSDGR